MKTTKSEFISALQQFGIAWVNRYLKLKDVTLPKIAEMVAIQCFIQQRPESRITEILRYQLKQLEVHGQFDFAPEETTPTLPSVRIDWLLGFAFANPEWGWIVRTAIEQNFYFVVPTENITHEHDSSEVTMMVLEEGIKGPSPRFAYRNNKIVCTNYPGGYKAMTNMEFYTYLERLMSETPSASYIEWIEHITEQEAYRAKFNTATGISA